MKALLIVILGLLAAEGAIAGYYAGAWTGLAVIGGTLLGSGIGIGLARLLT